MGSGSGMTPQEVHAQAALITRVVHDIYSPPQFAVFGYYTRPSRPDLIRRTEFCANMLGRHHLSHEMGGKQWFCVDVAREFCKLRPHHRVRSSRDQTAINQTWWARHFDVEERTIRNWKAKALDHLHRWLMAGEGLVEERLFGGGVI